MLGIVCGLSNKGRSHCMGGLHLFRDVVHNMIYKCDKPSITHQRYGLHSTKRLSTNPFIEYCIGNYLFVRTPMSF